MSENFSGYLWSPSSLLFKYHISENETNKETSKGRQSVTSCPQPASTYMKEELNINSPEWNMKVSTHMKGAAVSEQEKVRVGTEN